MRVVATLDRLPPDARDTPVSNGLRAQPLRIYVAGTNPLVELVAREGMYDLRRLAEGRRIGITSRTNAGAPSGSLELHIATRAPDGTWSDVGGTRATSRVTR